MAVYRWIYANAKMEGDRKDYHVRLCDAQLRGYQRTLIELSNRMLSADKRRGKAERQTSWFGGYLDKKMYVTAVGGDQRDLLGIEPDGYRAQHCVLAYGFTEKDICLYERKEELFEPLKKIMRKVQISGRDCRPDEETKITGQELLKYVQIPDKNVYKTDYNIIKSTKNTDDKLWKQSLNYPVMTGVISKEDAEKLLGYFPDGAVTVLEDVRIRYEVQSTEAAYKAVKKDRTPNAAQVEKTAGINKTAGIDKTGRIQETEKKDCSITAHKHEAGKELETLRKEQLQAQAQLMEVRAEKRRKEVQKRKAAVLFFFLLFFTLAFWLLL